MTAPATDLGLACQKCGTTNVDLYGLIGRCEVCATLPDPVPVPQRGPRYDPGPHGRVFPARYDGVCHHCGGHITAGEEIRGRDQRIGYVHARCTR